MTYLISFSADFINGKYVPVTRIYNSNIVSEDYKPEAGEYFTDEKPVFENEKVIDFTAHT